MPETQNFNLSEADYNRLKQGDPRLQTRVFDRYALSFVSVARTQFGVSVEDAEEIVSGAFAKLFTKVLSSGLEKDNLQGYVYTIIKHKCLERMEQKSKEILKTYDTLPDNIETETDSDLLEYLNKAFNRLGEPCRHLLSQFYWEDKEHKEIAALFGISEDASRQRKRECMKKLRQIVAKIQLAQSMTVKNAIG